MKHIKILTLLFFFGTSTYQTTQAQCFLEVIRNSDTSITVAGTGITSPSGLAGINALTIFTADIFAVNASPVIPTISNNTLSINGEPVTSVPSAVGLTFSNSVTGPFTATGEITLSWPNGLVNPIGTSIIIRGPGNAFTQICTTTSIAPAPSSSPSVPTLSQWGLIVLALLLMTFGTLHLLQPQFNQSKNKSIR